MKYIEIPPSVTVTSLNGDVLKDEKGEPVTVTFEQFVFGRLTDPKFAASMDKVLAAVEIRAKLKEAHAVLELENEHHKLLKDTVENPSQQAAYTPGLAHNLVTFMKAIVDAKDKKPETIDEKKNDADGAAAQAALS